MYSEVKQEQTFSRIFRRLQSNIICWVKVLLRKDCLFMFMPNCSGIILTCFPEKRKYDKIKLTSPSPRLNENHHEYYTFVLVFWQAFQTHVSRKAKNRFSDTYVFILESVTRCVSPGRKEPWGVSTDVVFGHARNGWEFESFIRNCVETGAIIGDGDRKSRDSRAPMIWDNFSIVRTNCAILTSYIRADSRTCQGLSRGCCHVAWSNGESWEILLRIFSQRWQGIRQGIRTRALICSLCSELTKKVGFSGSRTRLQSRAGNE